MQSIGLAYVPAGALAERMHGPVIAEGAAGYDDARRVWNATIDRRPALIARCAGTTDVIAAIEFAREHDLLVSIRGGGHNVAGTAMNDGGIVIDMSAMRGVRVDAAARTVWAQAGANWGDVDRETQLHGLAVPGGVVSETGIAGLTLSGGYSDQRRAHGMTIDNLIAAEVVLADGRVVRASEHEHPDLLWALRGGGGNFGVVTAFEYRAHPLGPEVFALHTAYPLEQAGEILRAYRDFVAAAPDELTADFAVWTLPDVEALPPQLRGKPWAGVVGMWAGAPEDAERAVKPLRELAEPLIDLSMWMPYVEKQRSLDPLLPSGGNYYWKSLYLDGISDELAATIAGHALERPSLSSIVVLRHLGGKIREVPPDATAFADRHAEFLFSVDASWEDPAGAGENIAWARGFYEDVERPTSARTYFNFASDLIDEGEDMVRSSYGPNYERLVDVKTEYDPSNVFRVNQNIKPRG